jgi:hypothetical protein
MGLLTLAPAFKPGLQGPPHTYFVPGRSPVFPFQGWESIKTGADCFLKSSRGFLRSIFSQVKRTTFFIVILNEEKYPAFSNLALNTESAILHEYSAGFFTRLRRTQNDKCETCLKKKQKERLS